MADIPLPSVPHNVQALDENGYFSRAWSAFFRGLYLRVGQANALTNTELEALSSGAEFQDELDALTATVTANKTAADQSFSDLNQGPNL